MVHGEWRAFCKQISGYKTVFARDLPELPSGPWAVVKHDVECDPKKALQIAKIEKENGIGATYYLQAEVVLEYPDIVKELINLGHEVGYHYDVLDACQGDLTAANVLFKDNLSLFKQNGADILSICPHGNPLIKRSGWTSNRDFFATNSIADQYTDIFDVVVENYKYLKTPPAYFSDAGYSLTKIADIRTGMNTDDERASGIDNIFTLLDRGQNVIVSTHPHRWYESHFRFRFVRLRFLLIKRLAILASKVGFIKRLMSQFYYLARRF